MKTKLISLLAFVLIFVGCSKESGQPSIKVVVSSNKETIYNNEEVTFTASSSSSISQIEFFLNGQSIGKDITEPYNIEYTPKNLSPGKHIITAIANSNEAKGETTISLVLRLGDEYQGGKIFYLDPEGKHGLIGSTSDLKHDGEFGKEVRFAWGSETLLGTTLSEGKKNTELMAANASSSGYAGFHFKNGGYSLNGYTDWYIPSWEELELLQENKSYVGGFSTATDWQAQYWSSSESNASIAFILNFNALMGNTNNKTTYFKIRPIRSF